MSSAMVPTIAGADEGQTDDDRMLRFDFGPIGGLVEPGFTEITRETLYDAAVGYGFVSVEDAIDRDRGEAIGNYMERDWIGGPEVEFLVDLEPGAYDVRITVGESGQARSNLLIEGESYGTLSARGGAVSQTFPLITVDDGQLNVNVTGNPGRINGLEIWPSFVGPSEVTAAAPVFDGAAASVELSWSAVYGAESYAIYRDSGTGAELVGTADGTSFVDDSVDIGRTYDYTIRGINAEGAESTPSAPLQVQIVDDAVAAPSAPVGLAVQAIERNSVTLAWDAVADALSYTVYRSDHINDEQVIAHTAAPTFTDEDVLTTIEYTYRVTATNRGGEGPLSTPLVTEAVTTLIRKAENLDRGVVAVRSNETEALISWRLLGLDPQDIGFVLERSTDDGAFEALHDAPLSGGTNFVDDDIDFTVSNAYRVRAVVDGDIKEPSHVFTLDADAAIEPIVRVPLREGGPIKFLWVGDLNGDGLYDYVIDRQTAPQSVEAYLNDGTFLWEMDLGHNSMNQNNISGGSSTISHGHNDGVTVFDLDSDGKAEVAIRIANGVTFGDGQVFNEGANDDEQFMAIIDGMTGELRDSEQFPTDFIEDGPLNVRVGIGYLDGENPSVVAYGKNRKSSGEFNLMHTAWQFDGEQVTSSWKFLRPGATPDEAAYPDGHNTRILDVDGDGLDDIAEIGFVLNEDGTVKYSLADQGIIHGDRFFIADIDPSRPGLEGYGIQQYHPDGVLSYYYDAGKGEVLWRLTTDAEDADSGRGMVGDIDPRHPGMEMWSISGEVNYTNGKTTGLYSGPTQELIEPDPSHSPWPHMGVWWDGDLLRELYNADPYPDNRDARIEKWDWENPTRPETLPREVTTRDYGAVTSLGNSVYPLLIADIHGDWREEVVLTTPGFDELVIFTTDIPTEHRLYTLTHNPAYRNAITLKGYQQSSNVDYFLGADMATPPQPNVVYAGTDATDPQDTVAPTVTVKEGVEFTVGSADDGYELVSFKLFDEFLIDKVAINGVMKDLTDNQWSDVNFVKPGVFGAVLGDNVLEVFDVAGNVTSLTFTLVEPAPQAPAWDPLLVYTTGDEVSHGGAVFVAQWWTQNQTPGDPTGPWSEVGGLVPVAGDDVRAWTASWIYTGGETVAHDGHVWRAKWWTRNQVPGDVYGPWEDLGTY